MATVITFRWITCTHHLCFCHFWLSPAAHPLHGATLQFNWKQVVVQKAITHLGCASLLWDTGRLLLSGLTDLNKRVWAQETQSLQGRFFLRQILGHVSRRDAGIRSIETGLCSLQHNREGIASKILTKILPGLHKSLPVVWHHLYLLTFRHAARPMCWSSSLRSLKRTGWWMGLQCLFTSVW